MSLDIYLTGPVKAGLCVCSYCGNEHEYESVEELYSANITHNLNSMADAAGIYQCLWRPEESGVTTARQLIEPLTNGIALMRSDSARFRAYNAANGWGTYDDFVPWLERLLAACEENPDADVRVSR